MAGIFRHRKVSAKADGLDATKVVASEWGSASTDYSTLPTHVLFGGATGSLVYYDSAAIDKGNFLAGVAVGQVLVSGGVATVPAWSAAPSLTTLALSSQLAVTRAAQGPSATFAQGNDANFLEFSRSNSAVKATFGMVGNPEANMCWNMKYDDSIHDYYDNTKAAVWIALNGAGMYMQYAPSGQVKDIWSNSGSLTPFYWDPTTGRSTQTGGGTFAGEIDLTGTLGNIGISVTSPKGRIQLWDGGAFSGGKSYAASSSQNGNGLVFDSYSTGAAGQSIRYSDIVSLGNIADPLGGSELRLMVNSSLSLTAIDALHIFRNGTVGCTIGRTLGGTAVAGAAGVEHEFLKEVTGIADATATTVLTVTVPNAAHAAMIDVLVMGRLGAGGAIGADEAAQSSRYQFTVVRTAGVASVLVASAQLGAAAANVAGSATATATLSVVNSAEGVGVTNTHLIKVTITKSGGSSASHKADVHVRLHNMNATGVTVA